MIRFVVYIVLCLVCVTTVFAVRPQCAWACDNPSCDAVCHAKCADPTCTVQCSVGDPSACHAPSCHVHCPEVEQQDATQNCPMCETICDPPHCPQTHTCTVLCEPTNCDWQCSPPRECAYPQCHLQCEAPACEHVAAGTRMVVYWVPLLVVLFITHQFM